MERAKQLMEMVAKYESLIYDTADYIWKNPETGYREWKTSAYMEEHFEALGYTLTKAGNIPGFYADLDTGRPGPKIAILGELDSLIVGNHPDADPETHAVHACGHNAQCAILLGVAAAMKEPGALDGLCGSIRFMAVPAEELIELGFREELRKQGVIRYFGGKVEFISRGYFDGVDMAMMIHSGKLPEGKTLSVSQGCNGCITKNITFKGVASHAGGSPHLGRSALDAAELMNVGCNYLREHMTIPFENNIKCSNYVGETIDMAIDMGVKGILFIAHIGKFVKVAAGIMNTHSHSADARMEVLASNAIRAGASLECAKEILNASTTDEAIDILEKYQILQKTMKEILDRIQFYLNHRSYEQILLGAVIFNNTYGYLGQTADAEKLIKLINAQNDEAQ